jgi:hypothetical protein
VNHQVQKLCDLGLKAKRLFDWCVVHRVRAPAAAEKARRLPLEYRHPLPRVEPEVVGGRVS